MDVALTSRLLLAVGLAVACGAAAAQPDEPRERALADFQQKIYQAGVGPATWHVSMVGASPGDKVQTVEVIGDLAAARRALDRRWPGQTRVVRGHIVSDLAYRRGHDYPFEAGLQSLDQPGFTVFKTDLAPDGHTTTVGVVGDLDAARAYLEAHYPGRTVVHGNTR
ncbi:hypothetical protein ACFRAR_28365 [Kitasatospora sp. NPDC056651]|uniref:hypothetical protein n=1 Tax=Kitasatospora sp. NPDC056651 TaxID=3345892 RepID=UPI0036CA3C4A